VGVNTFIIRDGNSIGFSLPANYLNLTIEEYLKGKYAPGVRCNSCMNIVFEQEEVAKYCTYCGSKITMIRDIEVYEPLGINKTIEAMLLKLGYHIELSRRGPNNWEIIRGSAKITISYHEKTGLIVGDALLCLLPKQNIKRLYEFLLRENYKNESLSFSVRNQDILISLLIYDQYLNTETATKIFQQLFEAADKYDDILVHQFGALWKEES
jgi:serine protease Do